MHVTLTHVQALRVYEALRERGKGEDDEVQTKGQAARHIAVRATLAHGGWGMCMMAYDAKCCSTELYLVQGHQRIVCYPYKTPVHTNTPDLCPHSPRTSAQLMSLV